jgi:azurin
MKIKILNLLAASSVMFFVSCGGEQTPPAQTESATVEETVVAEPELELYEVTVKAVGNTMADMAFEPANLEIPVNAKVVLTLVNEGKDIAMQHNIVFVQFGKGEEVASEGVIAGPKKNYLSNNANIVAGSEIAEPGATVTLEFVSPSTPGSLQYICTYPGHFPKMVGTAQIVE